MNDLLGILIIIVGVLVAAFGTLPITIKRSGWLLRIIDSVPNKNIGILVQSWIIALLLVLFGLALIFDAF